MNRPANTPRIALVVVNPQILRQGCAPSYSFEAAGGTIGSHGTDWLLSDNRERILPVHCEIVLDEGLFCVVDRSGLTRLNGSDAALGLHVSARLAEGDILHIGPYRVSAHLHDQQHALPDPSRHLIQYDLGELLNLQDERLDLFEQLSLDATPDSLPTAEEDLLQAWLEGAEGRSGDLDPLLALNAGHAIEETHQYSLIEDIHHGMTPPGTQPDLAATRFEAISGLPVARPEEIVRSRAVQELPPAPACTAKLLLDILQPSEPATAHSDAAPQTSMIPAPTQQPDATLTHAITIGLDAMLPSAPSRAELERFWQAFNQAYDQAQRTQEMEAQ